ncbi:cytochrome P450 [Pendulispora brunnea]|uniref:Cytochrome P450 n=1 Tax=Pendulispora brunnea TaxID=2905690 RepID=A0ABZ2K0N2_9BACT
MVTTSNERIDDLDFAPFAPEVLDDPYTAYAQLRERTPCYYVKKHDFWIVSRFDDLVAASKNHAVFSSTGGVGLEWKQRPMMPMYDPPEHSRLRRLVGRHFAPKAIANLTPRVERMVGHLLGRMFETSRADIVADLAEPLSLGVIADLMGVPESDRANFRKWADNVMGELSGGLNAEAAARAEASRHEFVSYLKELVGHRRRHPDPQAVDIISMLVAANESEALTHFEVTAFCVLLLVAGFEPTVNGVANTVLALLEHPDQARKLLADPRLLPAGIEEALRYDTPVQAFFRNTLTATEISGVALPARAKVMLHFGAANRDPRHYEEPDRFMVTRPMDENVVFGAGVHYCLGAPLARLQLNTLGRVALQRVRSVRRAGEIERASTLLFRGIRRFPVEVLAK